jgi:hypothetical protein
MGTSSMQPVFAGLKLRLIPVAIEAWRIQLRETDLDTFPSATITAERLKEIRNPFLGTLHDESSDAFRRLQFLRTKAQGPFLCPKCKEHSLALRFAGLWDGVEDEVKETETCSKHRGRRVFRTSIRWLGYALVVLGAALFLGSYLMTFNRGGLTAVADRFFSPFADAFLLGLCIGPGLILIGIAGRF